jgi:hypothetical protein
LRLWKWGVVQVEAIFGEVRLEAGTFNTLGMGEECGADTGNFNAPLRLIVAKTFAGRPVIRAEVRVCLDGSAIGVEGKDIGANGGVCVIPFVMVHAIQNGFESVLLQQSLVVDQKLNRHFSRSAQGEREQFSLRNWVDARLDLKQVGHFLKSFERTLPAERI